MFTFPIAHFGGALSHSIEQSIRFNDDDAAYLYRDNNSAQTDTKKFTYSVWIKRAAITGGTTEEEVDVIAPTHVPLVPDAEAGLGLAPWMWGTLVIAGALIAIYVVTI